jgi:hypothetical protein
LKVTASLSRRPVVEALQNPVLDVAILKFPRVLEAVLRRSIGLFFSFPQGNQAGHFPKPICHASGAGSSA